MLFSINDKMAARMDIVWGGPSPQPS
jgi:hypothetical protein